jgi:hypothetical protein
LVTGAEVLALAGTPRPTADQIAWADMAAAALTAAVEHYLEELPGYYREVLVDVLGDPRAIDETTPGYAELKPATELAALELYKRREAPFGATSWADAYGQAIRLSRDYLHPIMPTLRRWHPTAGVVAG